ncbi:MAG: CDGSH iron-sulfur domain-containing protein [Nitrospirae bacterium]|nr:CDGSH iron-sulfur domain-containing protein [Nitrospirota bacterium]MBI3351947.1 CDGSH iron-sulfur domain-containing protein [Nitrospirota bacterium]
MPDQKFPFVIDEKPGEKYWCACGESKNRPYCDGSHQKLNTGVTPIKVTIDQVKTVAWCGCRKSGNKPYCDGTHKKL